MAQKCPNITGQWNIGCLSTNPGAHWGSSGAFAPSSFSTNSGGGSNGWFTVGTIDASRVSNVYQSTTLIQPNSRVCRLLIRF